jgi:acyl-CoA synthetase (AMP-forming)/AMP-acid ligase II
VGRGRGSVRARVAGRWRAARRIVLLLPAIPDYLYCYPGAARIGAITARISTRYRRQEIGEISPTPIPAWC